MTKLADMVDYPEIKKDSPPTGRQPAGVHQASGTRNHRGRRPLRRNGYKIELAKTLVKRALSAFTK